MIGMLFVHRDVDENYRYTMGITPAPLPIFGYAAKNCLQVRLNCEKNQLQCLSHPRSVRFGSAKKFEDSHAATFERICMYV